VPYAVRRVGSGRWVLTLHRVVDAPELRHDLSWDGFVALLDLLAARKLPVSTDLHPDSGEPGSVVLTFDDGTEDHLRVARELAARGLPAIFFVPVGRLGEASRLAPEDVRALVQLGHLVGSHTVDHRRLSTLGEAELERQLVESKARLEALAGVEVDYFAPPGGIGHPSLPRALEAAGYAVSRSTRWGLYRASDHRFEVPCLPVTEVTWGRGWVQATLVSWELPMAMRIVWQVKTHLPTSLAMRIRSRVTRGR
jgi:peptidoglycan/xylan/chitin deacetylase (PgdA/CDA1 family)